MKIRFKSSPAKRKLPSKKKPKSLGSASSDSAKYSEEEMLDTLKEETITVDLPDFQLSTEISIGIPTCDLKQYCLSELLKSLEVLPYDVYIIDNSSSPHFFKRMKTGISELKKKSNLFSLFVGDRFGLKDSSRRKLTATRNLLRKIFLSGNAKYFLSLEADVIAQHEELLHLVKDYENLPMARPELESTPYILGALILRGGSDTVASRKIMYQRGRMCKRINYPFEMLKGNMVRVRGIHMACTLIPRKILEEITFRHDIRLRSHDDTYFSLDVVRKGHQIFCDGMVTPKHLFRDWPRSLIV